jgi:serine/threonine-protein kinase
MSPDGTQLVFTENGSPTEQDVMLLPLEGPSTGLGAGKPRTEPLVQTKFQETHGALSPDGRWLAYQSDESGQNEVHVRPFPTVNGGHWQVSSAGGVKPVWAPSGRELFYLDPTRALMAVAVHATSMFTHGNPTKLFDAPYYQPVLGRVYDVSRDGQKFLMIKDAPSGDPASTLPNLVVVLNWVEELKARLPAK